MIAEKRFNSLLNFHSRRSLRRSQHANRYDCGAIGDCQARPRRFSTGC